MIERELSIDTADKGNLLFKKRKRPHARVPRSDFVFFPFQISHNRPLTRSNEVIHLPACLARYAEAIDRCHGSHSPAAGSHSIEYFIPIPIPASVAGSLLADESARARGPAVHAGNAKHATCQPRGCVSLKSPR